MKKNLLLVLLAMVVCVSLVACMNDTSDEELENEDSEYEEIIEVVDEDLNEEIDDSEVQKILDDATLPSNEEIIKVVKKCEEKIAELSGDEETAVFFLVDDCLVCYDEALYVVYSMENEVTTGAFTILPSETEDEAKETYEQLIVEASGEDISGIELIGKYIIAGEKIEESSETMTLSDFETLCALYGSEIIKL